MALAAELLPFCDCVAVRSRTGKHTIFGRVYSGMKVVQRIGLAPTGKDDKPVEDIKILATNVL